MESLKHRWKSVPTSVRKPIVLVVGMLFVIASGLTGWLPGPGGIPLFLIGVAILATEYAWAKRLRDWVLNTIHRLGAWWRGHKVLGSFAFAAAFAVAITIAFFAYRGARQLISSM